MVDIRHVSGALVVLLALVWAGVHAWRRLADRTAHPEPTATVTIGPKAREISAATQRFAQSLQHGSIDRWSSGRAMLATHLADLHTVFRSLPEDDLRQLLIGEIGHDAAALIDGLPRIDRAQLTLLYAFVGALRDDTVTVGRAGSELVVKGGGLDVSIGRRGRLRTLEPVTSPDPELAWRLAPRRWWPLIGVTARSSLVMSALRAHLADPKPGERRPLEAAPFVHELVPVCTFEHKRWRRPESLAGCSMEQLMLLVCCRGRALGRHRTPLLLFRFGSGEEALVALDGAVLNSAWQRGKRAGHEGTVLADGRFRLVRELLCSAFVGGVIEAALGTAWLAVVAAALWFVFGWAKSRIQPSERRRRRAVGLAAGLFQGPSFFWAQFAALIGKATHETGIVQWSALGLVLALAFGLLTVFADRLGARRLIVTVCATTLGGAALIAVGGANLRVLPAFALIAVTGTFMQFGATRAGVLVSAHETAGMDAAGQLKGSRALRRWFEVGIYAPSFFLGAIADRWGWVTVYGLLTLLYALALRVLRSSLRGGEPAPVSAGSDRARRRSLVEGLRTALRHPMLLTTALAALVGQAAVFATVQGLPVIMRADHVSSTIIGVVQGSAMVAALFVTRPKRMPPDKFGRRVPIVGIVAVSSAGVAVSLLGGGLPSIALAGLGIAALAFISAELLKQQGQMISQVQARQYAPPELDYVWHAIWILGANIGSILGALGAAQFAKQPSHIAWLLFLGVAAAGYVAITLAWYRRAGRTPAEA